jgi:hypothetical protein
VGVRSEMIAGEEGILGAVKLFYMILLCWVYDITVFQNPKNCTIQRTMLVDTRVFLIIICQY